MKFTMKPFLLFLGILAIVAIACTKASFHSDVPTPDATVLDITASISGRVLDQQGKPILGATVTTATSTTRTNINGEFLFSNIPLNSYAAYVRVSKPGFFKGSRMFTARQSQIHHIEIELLSKADSGIINDSVGGSLVLTNGASLTLDSNSVANSAGGIYKGNVHVAMVWLDPTSSKIGKQMPGDLRGIDSTSAERLLTTYGMLAVELSDDAGATLQIASGKKATISLPIPSSRLATAPNGITLWSFSDSTGFWKQESTANKVGNKYVGQVSHFSFWNCDIPVDFTHFSATFRDLSNKPLVFNLIRITQQNGNARYGYTDSTGYVAGLVPANEVLKVEVVASGACQNVQYSKIIGPYTANTYQDEGVLNVNTLGTFGTATISGLVRNCKGDSLSNGFLALRTAGGLNYGGQIVNGVYSFSIPMCASQETVTFYAFDTAGNYSNTVSAYVYPGKTNTLITFVLPCPVVITDSSYIDLSVNRVKTLYNNSNVIDSTLGGNKFIYIYGTVSNVGLQTAFSIAGDSIGNYPVTPPALFNSILYYGNTSVPTNATITRFDNVGGYIQGNFMGYFTDTSGTKNDTIFCTFKVKRIK